MHTNVWTLKESISNVVYVVSSIVEANQIESYLDKDAQEIEYFKVNEIYAEGKRPGQWSSMDLVNYTAR